MFLLALIFRSFGLSCLLEQTAGSHSVLRTILRRPEGEAEVIPAKDFSSVCIQRGVLKVRSCQVT
jgi:hypothetical protein